MWLAWLAVAALLVSAEPKKAGLEVWASDVDAVLSEPRDSMSLVARTRVPSACYEAAGTTAQPPPGYRIVDHLAPLQLLVRRNPAISCAEAPGKIVLIEHRHANLDLKGRTGMVVFVVVDGKVVASWNRVW